MAVSNQQVSWQKSRRGLAVVASFATMFMLGISISLLGPSLPGLAEQTGVPLAHTGILFTLFSGGSLAATLLIAGLMDRPARHALLIAGPLLLAGALWTVPHGSSLAQVGVTIGVAGLALSTVGVAPNAIIAACYGERSSGVFNVLHLMSGAGSFVGPLMVGAALRLDGSYAAAFRLASGLAVLLTLLWAFSLPPRPLSRATSGLAVGAGGLAAPLAVLAIFTMLYLGVEQAIGGWIFSYAEAAIGASVAAASFATSLFWLCMLLGRLGAAAFAARAGNMVLLTGGVILAVAGLGVELLASRVPALLWPGVVLAGMGLGPLFPTALATGTQAAPQHAGAVSALLVASGSVGAMVLPWTSGLVMAEVGTEGSMAISLLALAVMLGCLFVLRRTTRGSAGPHS